MVVDTSALVAVLLEEPLADTIGPLLLGSAPIIAAPNYLEAHMVLAKHYGVRTADILQQRLAQLGITVVEFTPEQAVVAARAFDQYGKGRHPASLNFGDCIAYALAKSTHQRLLFVGQDFAQTDVRAALMMG
ncbi:vapC tRNA(fMet)-specific endonuclease VapC [Fimbriimonadaceae bacterium]